MHDLSALGNRLRKTYATRKKWAARLGIEAYRVYELDIPELRYIIDVYKDHAVIYDQSSERDGDELPPVDAVSGVVSEALGLEPEHLHFKLRRRMPGASQYEKLGAAGALMTVAEQGSRYLVNLSDYLDTGLFLDHRPLRSRFRALPAGQRLLNLFCYTGSVSVAAAQSGAFTTSVDMSNTYIDWAKDNFRANQLDPAEHELIREDALRFLQNGPGKAPRYDLIFLDPPTFSNSKKMHASFDVQRDHRRLIELAMAFLAPSGRLYFSTNRRRFVLDEALKASLQVEDISEQTIPEDFRNRKIHRCFTLEHR